MNLKDKTRMAHLEAQNAVAVQALKLINEATKELDGLNVDDVFREIRVAIDWFKKYGGVKLD